MIRKLVIFTLYSILALTVYQPLKAAVYAITNKGNDTVSFSLEMSVRRGCSRHNAHGQIEPGQTTKVDAGFYWSPYPWENTHCSPRKLTLWQRRSDQLLYDSSNEKACFPHQDAKLELIQKDTGVWSMVLVYP